MASSGPTTWEDAIKEYVESVNDLTRAQDERLAMLGGGWMPPPTAAPTPTAEPPRHYDSRLGEHKRLWDGKLVVKMNGVDVTATIVAAHSGEGWVVQFANAAKDLATDPLVISRGRVTIDKKA